MYGRSLTPRAILTGTVPAPADAKSFLATVANAKSLAAENRKKED